MAKDRTVNLMDRLRRAVLDGGKADRTDGQLLEDYLSRRDEAAMAVLVRRHGPMVWGVCRRVLHDYHDAEDAFQAAFLVLVRKAASVVPRAMVGNWLYGVAHQTALKARATTAKRQARERPVKDMPEPAARPEPVLWDDLEPLLDLELSRLPDKYRAAVVLCDLEGKTRKEAARQLQIPEGTLSTRLRTARTMLAKRLARHGLAVSGGALAAVLSQKAASAGVPTSVAYQTIKVITLAAAGQTAATGAISVKVTVLTEGVMKAMLYTRLKSAFAVVLILGILATGATIFTCRSAAGEDYKPPTTEQPVKPPQKQAEEKESFTAWGEEAGGLQAGLGYLPGEHRAYQTGETVNLVVRVRNVSKEDVKFQYLKEFFRETSLAVTDSKGKQVLLREFLDTHVLHIPVEVNLEPGKEIELYERMLVLSPEYGTGTVQIQYERVFGNSSFGRIKLDPTLSKLATGKLELEVKDAEATPPGKDEGLKKKLLELDEQWWKGDVETLGKLAADDLITVSGVGRYDKAALLEASKNRHAADWTRRAVEVSRVSKDVAIVTYVYDCKIVLSNGTPVQDCRDRRVSMTWVNREGGWVVVFSQETILPGGE